MKYALILICVALNTTVANAADWTQFRGPQGRSTLQTQTAPPTTWNDTKNIAWRVDLPGRGPSGPIVVGDRVFVSCSSGYHQDRLHVLCFDVDSGEQLWHRQFWATGRTMTHPSSANAAPTPASDGESVFAFYSSNDLVCLDLAGNLRWFRGLAYDHPKAGNDVGMASSPVVADGSVVVQVENQGDSFVAAINTATGETNWRLQRPQRANWSSPVIANAPDGSALVLMKSGDGLDAHDLATGEKRWSFESSAGGIPSVATLPGQILLPADGITALRLKNANETPEVIWSSNRLNPSNASPIVTEDSIYTLNRAGVLSCANLADGDLEWQLRLKGSFWATPVLAGNYLFCINDAGVAQVVQLGDEGTLVATNEFAETIQGSPAVSDGALYVRSDKSLWKIAKTR